VSRVSKDPKSKSEISAMELANPEGWDRAITLQKASRDVYNDVCGVLAQDEQPGKLYRPNTAEEANTGTGEV
jgi:hypothetical protein